MKTKQFCYALIITLASSHLAHSHNTNNENCFTQDYRCVIDIGSIATKIGCVDRLGRFHFEAEQPVGYRADYQKQQKNHLHCFSNEIKHKGAAAIMALQDAAREAIHHYADKVHRDNDEYAGENQTAFHGLATASLRPDPACGEEMSAHIYNQTHVPLTIIEQMQEGQLAFNGMILALNQVPEKIISWDLGGGSMQIIGMNNQERIHFLVEEGMFFFRSMLMKALHKNEETYHNQLTREEIVEGWRLAEKHALNNIAHNPQLQTIKTLLQNEHCTLMGTDGVAFIISTLLPNEQGKIYREEIEDAILECANHTDQDLQKKFQHKFISPAFLSGALLIVGYMRALDVDEITLFTGGALRLGALIEDSFFN